MYIDLKDSTVLPTQEFYKIHPLDINGSCCIIKTAENTPASISLPLPNTDFLLIDTEWENEFPRLEYKALSALSAKGYKGIGISCRHASKELELLGVPIIFEGLCGLKYNIGKTGIIRASSTASDSVFLEWNPKIRGAAFDVDGTILESMTVWEQVTSNFYQLNNLTLERAEAVKFQEMTMTESMPYIKNKYNLSMSTEEMAEKFKELIREEYRCNLSAKPYVIEYIKKLHSDGIKLAVATSGYLEFCRSAFERIGIYDLFDNYTLSSEVGVNKSHPDVYLLAAKRMGIRPEECMVFEDIPSGIIGAKKGGFLTCAVYDDTNIELTEKLREESDIYIKSWNQLL